jgi:23S rRNA pseudouridine1911/1915/1917 synthase
MITIVVEHPEDEDQRADVVLGRRVPTLSRRIARAIALRGKLRVGGRVAPPSTRVRRGDRLELLVELEPAREPAVVLATTEAFVYVDKPAGVHTHRLRPDDDETLADRVALVHPECAEASLDPREGGAIHRLDRETSGVVVFARSKEAWARGRAAIARARKHYLAVCRCEAWPPDVAIAAPDEPVLELGEGIPPLRAGTAVRLVAPLGRGARPDTVTVVASGDDAVTTVWPLLLERGLLACALELCGGRRHQLRVHLAWAGIPIVGDARYGTDADAERLLLHAHRLDLGVDGEGPVLAPPPPVLRSAWAGGVVSSD